jgi:hypothetical protein
LWGKVVEWDQTAVLRCARRGSDLQSWLRGKETPTVLDLSFGGNKE